MSNSIASSEEEASATPTSESPSGPDDALRAESYRSLFNSVPEALFISESDGRLLDVNHAATEMVGYSREELIGQTHEMISCLERVDFEGTRHLLGLAMAGEPQHLDWWVRRSDGSCFPMEVSLSPGQYFGRKVVLAVGRDVSRIRKLEERLREAEKLQAVGRFAGGIAHHFNNALAIVQGHAELAVSELGDHPVVADLNEILRATRHAGSLVRQLTTFSRQGGRTQTEIVDLGELVAGLNTLLLQVTGEDVRLTIDIEEALPSVEADRAGMERLILHLVRNARDAVEPGGTVRLSLHTVGWTPDNAGSEDRHSRADWICLKVQDDGMGMDRETARRAFEPFFTTKQGGTGLGLSIAHGMVREAGGEIQIRTNPRSGSEVEVLWPSLRTASSTTTVQNSPGEPSTSRPTPGT